MNAVVFAGTDGHIHEIALLQSGAPPILVGAQPRLYTRSDDFSAVVYVDDQTKDANEIFEFGTTGPRGRPTTSRGPR